MVSKWFHRIFSIPEGDRPWYSVVVWWEMRRPLYNLVVGISGTISLFLIFFFIWLPPALKGDDADFDYFIAIGAFGIFANFFYTFGWIFELLQRSFLRMPIRRIGPLSFSLGTIFSSGLALVPAAIFFFEWVYRALKK
jgi:hypothetical protein